MQPVDSCTACQENQQLDAPVSLMNSSGNGEQSGEGAVESLHQTITLGMQWRGAGRLNPQPATQVCSLDLNVAPGEVW